MDENIIRILNQTKSIAIVGLSPNPTKTSHKIAKYLLENGYKIIPIYPKEDEILGQKVYRSLEQVEEEIDMVNMFRKAQYAKDVFEQIQNKKNIKSLWLQLGIVNDSVKELAKQHNLDFVQDKCIMIEIENYKGLK